MDANSIVATLDGYARANGVRPVQPHYIWGMFNIEHQGDTLYSDEAHEYCEQCAEALLLKVLPLLSAEARDDHRMSATDCDSEDTCKHCMVCGKLLDYGLNSFGVRSELEYYEIQFRDREGLPPGDAFHVARIIEADPTNPDVLTLATAAIARLRTQAPAITN